MSDKKVISYKQIPSRPPITLTLGVVGCLKAFEASRTWWAVSITLLVLVWIGSVVGALKEDQVEIEL